MSDILILQLIGWLYLAIGAGMFINRQQYKKLLESLLTNRALMLVIGIIAFITGFALIKTHNTWGVSWQNTLVSLLGWVVLLKSAWIIVFPEFGPWASRLVNFHKHMTPIGAVIGGIGIILLFFTL
jgi:uncharacterized membrane protein